MEKTNCTRAAADCLRSCSHQGGYEVGENQLRTKKEHKETHSTKKTKWKFFKPVKRAQSTLFCRAWSWPAGDFWREDMPVERHDSPAGWLLQGARFLPL
jgi:hypothetical protein